jgi:hypothetical protein
MQEFGAEMKDQINFYNLTMLASNCGLPAGTVKLTPYYLCIAATTPSPTATPSPAAIMSAAEKAVSPKVVSKMTLAQKLTADQQTSVRSGYAAAAGVPMQNVEMAQDARRAVTYTVTVFVKDSAAAKEVLTKLSDTAALKIALKAAVPDPRTIHSLSLHVCVCACVCVCVCVCVCAGTHGLTPLPFPRLRVSPSPS